jgi:UDP-N-acetylglucosamine diphosphorylase/glucosamine-1-phosphate N-acetyltransferase
MSGPLVLYDDARARAFAPFALTRPIGELRAGADLVRRRWERAAGRTATGTVSAPHLAEFAEFDAPPAARGRLAAGTVLVNARCVPALDAALGDVETWECGGRVAAVRLRRALDTAALADGSCELSALAGRRRGAMPGWWLDEVWDLVRHLPSMLAADAAVLAEEMGNGPSVGADVLGEHAFVVARGAFVEPHVVVDTTVAPVIVMNGARVAAFTRLAGPCVIGPHAFVNGGRIGCCAVGEHSRVHGELSVVIVVGHANKAHDGFVGHSVIGRWANLGAGTITSNLKNSYGTVTLWTPSGVRPTGLQFLGSLIGDHVKTAIGTRLTTGTVIGAGANVFGDHSPPRVVPPFAWGDRRPYRTFELEKFLEVAERVMRRRDVPLTDAMRRTLSEAWREAQRARRRAAPVAPSQVESPSSPGVKRRRKPHATRRRR